MTGDKAQLTDEQVLKNQKLWAPPAIVSVSFSLSLGKLLRIVFSFSFTKHHKTMLKNKAFHTFIHASSNENNINGLSPASQVWLETVHGYPVSCRDGHLYRPYFFKKNYS